MSQTGPAGGGPGALRPGPPLSPLTTSAPNTRVERAFAFVDLCGFTDFADLHGDDDAVLELRALRSTVRDVAPLTGVRIAKWLGDGVMLVGVDCEALVAAVLTIHQRHDAAGRLPLRAGIANGDVILMEGDDYVGKVVNVAARLCEVADPGQVIAWVDHLRTPGWVTWSPLGTYRVRGIAGAVDAVALTISIEPGEPGSPVTPGGMPSTLSIIREPGPPGRA
jgi:class 3 adenylate cyclase